VSIGAVNWAIESDDLSPNAKLVLILLANYADEFGESYPSQEILAQRTKQSTDSVQRRIADLIAAGLLFKIARSGADGRRMHNRYVVLHDEKARLHAVSLGWTPPASSAADRSLNRMEEGETGLHAADCGMDHAANGTEPCRNQNETMPHCCGVTHQLTINNTSPLPPKGVLGEGDASRGQGKKTPSDLANEAWEALRKVWPWNATELPEAARTVFLRLTDDERRQAIDCAPRYIAECRRGDRKIAHAKSWLAGKGWQVFEGRSAESAAALAGAAFFVLRDSRQAAAWMRYEAAVHGKPLLKFIPTKRGEGCYRPSEWPPPIPEELRGKGDAPGTAA